MTTNEELAERLEALAAELPDYAAATHVLLTEKGANSLREAAAALREGCNHQTLRDWHFCPHGDGVLVTDQRTSFVRNRFTDHNDCEIYRIYVAEIKQEDA